MDTIDEVELKCCIACDTTLNSDDDGTTTSSGDPVCESCMIMCIRCESVITVDDEYNDVEDFVNYVIDIMMYDIFPHTDYEEIPTYEKILIHLLGDKIREFWEENQS